MNRPSDEIIKDVLNGDATPEQGGAIARWFATTAGQMKLSDLLDEDRAQLERYGASDNSCKESARIFRLIQEKIEARKRRRIFAGIAAVVVPIIFIVGAAVLVNNRVDIFGLNQYIVASTQSGERLQVMFQDGTTVHLNSNSTLQYPKRFKYSRRQVALSGEAYFEVASNKKWPFVVTTNCMDVNVKGTSFNVSTLNSDNEATVALVEGLVVVNQDGNNYTLEPNEMLIYNKEENVTAVKSNIRAEQYALWKDGIISFNNASTSSIIAYLENWYDVKFEILDSKALKYSFTITTNPNPQLKSVLNEINMLSPVYFDIQDDIIKISTTID